MIGSLAGLLLDEIDQRSLVSTKFFTLVVFMSSSLLKYVFPPSRY